MDLCTLSDIKLLLGIPPETTKEDNTIEHIISAVSAYIEKWLLRKIEKTSRTEYFTVTPRKSEFLLSAYPNITLTSVKNAVDWDWDNADSISSDWLNANDDTGLLYVWSQILVSGIDSLQVVYTGGMAETTYELREDYPDIALAAEQQVIAVFNQRKHFGVSSSGVSNVSVGYNYEGLISSVKSLLRPHRRMVV